MRGVLNESTNVVHRPEDGDGRPGVRTTCGATNHVTDTRLQRVDVARAVSDEDASRCGRCFADAGGY
jgi:hypothetical protein